MKVIILLEKCYLILNLIKEIIINIEYKLMELNMLKKLINFYKQSLIKKQKFK
jgi:hypothetical protein